MIFNCHRLLVFILVVHANLYVQAQQSTTLSNLQATAKTKTLYKNLQKLSAKGYLFGHQDDLAYGVNWRYQSGRSDVKEACGDYPAMYGYDLGGLEKDRKINLDSVPFNKMCQYIKDGYKRGGVVTLSWHFDNPLTGGSAWDTTHGAVASILNGGAKHQLFITWLDKFAAFIQSLKGTNNELIPILFRPFHELTGNWFWWGPNNCTPEQFKDLWKFTFNYLTMVKKCHNLIFVYNTGGDFTSKQDFLQRYPGNDFADIISFDTYQYSDPAKDDGFQKNTAKLLTILDSAAAETHKLTAIAETGYEAVPYPNWWTDVLQKAIGDHNISYVLLWRNHGYHKDMKKMHYYVPYKGQVSQQNFIEFYKDKRTLFEKDAAMEKLYKTADIQHN